MCRPGDEVMLYDIPDEKQSFEVKVKELCKQYPNDLELGAEIRKLVMNEDKI